jgi:FlaG/FlaF family flagellin (archaellin)
MKSKRLPNGMRGISPLIATLILIIATVACGAVVFAVARGLVGSHAGGADLEITNADIIVAGGARLATVNVKNVGTVNLENVSATVTVDSGTNVTILLDNIAIGQTKYGENSAGQWTAGRTYIVSVKADALDGSRVVKSLSVVAHG